MQPKHVHFIGIGGTGLSAIARVMLEQGVAVSGSDRTFGPLAEALDRDGATIYTGHEARNVAEPDFVVRSSAVPEDNVEVQAAREKGIPVYNRAEMLPKWLPTDRTVIAVAGAHGKTTTAAMIAWVLYATGRDPGFIVGGVLNNLKTNARWGKGPFIIEADEYDNMFLGIRPNVIALTNIEWDHPDMFPNEAAMVESFEQFVALLPDDGLLVACADSEPVLKLAEARHAARKPIVTYGLDHRRAAWQAGSIQANVGGGSDFVVMRSGKIHGSARLVIPGRHNVLNALAVFAVAHRVGIPFEETEAALSKFRGTGRRFQVRHAPRSVTVVDDYAHHPTAIRATLSAARQTYGDKALWAVFQPHTYSRVKALYDDFARSFGLADHVLIMPIFAARETDTLGMSAESLAGAIHAPMNARAVQSLDQAVDVLAGGVEDGAVVIVMSAGDGVKVSDGLVARLEQAVEAVEYDAESSFLAGYDATMDEDPFSTMYEEEAEFIEMYGMPLSKEEMHAVRKLARERRIEITPELVQRVVNSLRSGEEIDFP